MLGAIRSRPEGIALLLTHGHIRLTDKSAGPGLALGWQGSRERRKAYQHMLHLLAALFVLVVAVLTLGPVLGVGPKISVAVRIEHHRPC